MSKACLIAQGVSMRLRYPFVSLLCFVAVMASASLGEAAPITYSLEFTTLQMRDAMGGPITTPSISPVTGSFIYDPDTTSFLNMSISWGGTAFTTDSRLTEAANRDCGGAFGEAAFNCSSGGAQDLFEYLTNPGTNNLWRMAITIDPSIFFWFGADANAQTPDMP